MLPFSDDFFEIETFSLGRLSFIPKGYKETFDRTVF